MNELYFLGTDIVVEVKDLMKFMAITATDGMTDNELRAYQLGIDDTIAALKSVLDGDGLPVINIRNLEVPTELSVEEVAECFEVTY
jgi:hypothetical protein